MRITVNGKKMKNSIFTWIIVLFGLLLFSCGNEQKFSIPTISNSTKACDHRYYPDNQINETFSDFIKPKVDILILWDNSTSMSHYKNNLIKTHVENNLNHISSDFDIHMLFAPLIVDPKTPHSFDDGYLIADNYDGLSESVVENKLTLKEDATTFLENFSSIGGSIEHGLKRVEELLDKHIKASNGIFRKNANTIVLLISSGDDSATSPWPNDYANKYFEFKENLGSEIFRFISLVPHQADCFGRTGVTVGSRYKLTSQFVSDSSSDSFNACNDEGIDNTFEHINDIISRVDHVYDYWPIANSSKVIDTNYINVKKFNTQENKIESVLKNKENGFQYFGISPKLKIRRLPTRGETKENFHFIKLSGNAEVHYPDFLMVETRSEPEYFGYIRLQYKPYLKNLYLEINGKEIPQKKDDPDGWYIVCPSEKIVNYMCTQNAHSQEIQIKAPNDWTPKGPKLKGYFLKLGQNVTYTNNSVVKVRYHPNSKPAAEKPSCIGPQN